VVAPGQGESLRSWMDRMAARNRCPPGVMAGLLGLPMGGWELRRPILRPMAFGVVSTPAARSAIEAATGVGAEAVRAMHLEVFDGTALALGDVVVGDEVGVGRIAVREWALFYASRACPGCLSESGGVWLTWWKLGWAAACPRHGTMLIDVCPACGAGLRRGQAGRIYKPSLLRAAEPLRCLAPLGRGLHCRQDLSALAASPAAAVLVEDQARLLEIAAGAPGCIGGQMVAARGFFAAMRLLAVLVRLGQPQSLEVFGPAAVRARSALRAELKMRSQSRGGPTASARVPASAWAAGGLAAVCLRVLQSRDEVELAERLRALVSAAGVGRWGSRLDAVLSGREPEVLTWAVRQVRLHPGCTVLRQAPPTSRWPLQARHLPPFAPRRDYLELIAPLLPTTGEVRGRRYAAMAAIRRSLGLETWAQAGALCGLEGAHAVGIAGHCGRALTDVPGFWAAIDVLLDRLAADGPVDYAARRACLSGLRTVPEPVWREILRGTGVAVTPKRACNAAAWLWAQLTCGYWRQAPAARDPAASAYAGYARRADAFKVFIDWLPPLVEARLCEFGQRLLREGCIS